MPMSSETIPLHDFIKDDASSIPFQLIPLEKKSHYDSSKAHRHNYYEIFIFNEGGGTHYIDFEAFPIASNSVHFVSPGQVHLVQRELNSHGYVILFSRDFYYLNQQDKNLLFELPFLNNNNPKPIIELNDKQFEFILQLMQQISQECEETDASQEPLVQSYLNILLLKCKQFYHNDQPEHSGPPDPIMQLVYKFRIMVEQQFRNMHLVKEYANELAVSPEQLNEATKKHLGRHASDMIADRILLEAKRLLLHSALTTKEVAFFLNFEDPSYFSRFFRNKAGQTPTQFKTLRG